MKGTTAQKAASSSRLDGAGQSEKKHSEQICDRHNEDAGSCKHQNFSAIEGFENTKHGHLAVPDTHSASIRFQ
ncbi:MAG TPA: hypothetical protein VEK31_08935 [Xanthobacteraceae bacterium]|nr:hypothetical protein [Xanthobacteraceae bacterium]